MQGFKRRGFRMMSFRAALLAGVTGALLSAGSPASADSLVIVYDVSLASIPIGTATVNARLEGDHYNLDAKGKLTGLAGALAKSSGAATASGQLGPSRPLSTGYALTASNSEMTRTVRMAMTGGNVQAAEIVPPLEEKADRVPVTEANKRNVVDPVSAMLMPMAAPAQGGLDQSACNRTIPVYDGATRFDIVLSYKGTRNVKSETYNGPVAVCSVRYVPQAGHRANRPGTKFMTDNRDMEAWLAPVGKTRVLVPYRVSVRTMVGTSVVQASKFLVQGSTASIGEKKPD